MKRKTEFIIASVFCVGLVPISMWLNAAVRSTHQRPIGKTWKLKSKTALEPDVICDNVSLSPGSTLIKRFDNSTGELRISADYQTLVEEIRVTRYVPGSSYPNGRPLFKGVPATQWNKMVSAFNAPANKNPYWFGGAGALGTWTVQAHVFRDVIRQTWVNTEAGHEGETSEVIEKGPPITRRTWTWVPANKQKLRKLPA